MLVAEDNEVGQFIASEMLGSLGIAVQVVGNGREAWEAVRDGRYALVLMDCRMPEWDGFEAARAIRRHEAETGRTRTPIVAMTANTSEVDRERCLEAGMDGYLAKPYLPEELGAILRRWMPSTVQESGGERARPPAIDGARRPASS